MLTIFDKTNSDVIQLFLTICKNYKLFTIFCELYPKIKNRHDNILNGMITSHDFSGDIERRIDNIRYVVFDKPSIIISNNYPYIQWHGGPYKRTNNQPICVSIKDNSYIYRKWTPSDDFPESISGDTHYFGEDDCGANWISTDLHVFFGSFKCIK